MIIRCSSSPPSIPMDLLIDVILRAGRSAVELSFFILLPVMIVTYISEIIAEA